MDVIYPCRFGENEELRYSLRSLAKNMDGIGRVVLFGHRPDWYTGDYVYVAAGANKWQNAAANLRAALDLPRLADEFLLMNDDFFIMQPTKPALFHRGPIRKVIPEMEARLHKPSRWVEGFRNTLTVLESLGYENPYSYELHVPMPLTRDALAEAFRIRDAHRDIGPLQLRSLAGAVLPETGRKMADVKVYDYAQRTPKGTYLSTDDDTFERYRPGLQNLFPEPSPWEG